MSELRYATLADLTRQITAEELARLCDDTGQGLFVEVEGEGEPDEEQLAAAAAARAVAERAIIDAADEIDAYVGTRKAVPMADPPPLLRRLVVDLALYGLYGRRGLSGMSEGRQTRYEAARTMLRDISTGRISLGAEPDAPLAKPANITGSKSSSDRVFSATTLAGF
jgi:phage gp36-like protein